MRPSKLNEFLNGTGNGKDTDKKCNGRKSEGEKATHGSMTGGAWAIDSDDMPEFYKLYCEYLNDGHGDLHMTEKSTRISALRIDLDFVYAGKKEHHLHTQEQVISFIGAYMSEVKNLLQVPPSVEIFVSEKRQPTYYAATEKKGDYSKSGIHVVVPSLKTTRHVEEHVRRMLLKRMGDFFTGLPLADKWDKVYDHQMLSHTNNWTMLGSKKKDGLPYKIKYILDWDAETGDMSIDTNVPRELTVELVSQQSLRSPPSMETPMTEEAVELFRKAAEAEEIRASMGQQRGRTAERDKPGSRGSTPERNTYRQPLSDSDVALYTRHVMNLKPDRYNTRDQWIKVGICLKNIHPDSLEALFYDFSAQWKDYDPRAAQIAWNSFNFRTDGPVLSVRSLRAWSREDNPGEYEKIENENIEELVVEAAKTQTEHDMARVVFAMFRDEFKCSDYGQNTWYRFVGHVWRLTKKGVGLLAKLSSDVWVKFVQKENELGKRKEDTMPCPGKVKGEESHTCEMCKLEKEKEMYVHTQRQLKKTAFKKNVMEECRLLFLDEELELKLDTNKNLIAFDNCVYDTLNFVARDGKAEDYMSFTTELEYHVERRHTDYACWADLQKFLCGILPDKQVREYFLAHLATCLVGGNPAQKFHILTGSGSNGKSMLMILMATCMGMYACKAPITLLTQDRGKAGVANPELVRMKGKRFVTMQEPEEGANIKTGLMKELSSCEKITARDLFAGSKEMVDIDIQAHFHVSCNTKPKVDAQDGGTWRRLCVVNFVNKFVANPTAPNELPDDKNIQQKVESIEWAECMMNYLIFLLKDGSGFRKLTPPDTVLEYTNSYKNETDIVGRFIQEFVHPLEEGAEVAHVTTGEINRQFQAWKHENQFHAGNTSELRARLEERYGKFPRNGWTSFRFAPA